MTDETQKQTDSRYRALIIGFFKGVSTSPFSRAPSPSDDDAETINAARDFYRAGYVAGTVFQYLVAVTLAYVYGPEVLGQVLLHA